MKTTKLTLSATALAVILLVGSCMKEAPLTGTNSGGPNFTPDGSGSGAPDIISSVMGNGVLNQNGIYLDFRIQAQKASDGTVSGTFDTFTSPTKSQRISGQIVCLTVSGSEATLSVRITSANSGNPWGVTNEDFLYFRVKASASNPGSVQGQVTDLIFTGTTQWDCSQTEPQKYYAFHDITAGDIVIK